MANKKTRPKGKEWVQLALFSLAPYWLLPIDAQASSLSSSSAAFAADRRGAGEGRDEARQLALVGQDVKSEA